MSERVRGTVISVHALGAAVRLEDGRLVAAPAADVHRHRATYTRALSARTLLAFELAGRSVILAPAQAEQTIAPSEPAPSLSDPTFEAQITAYLKQTEEWAPIDRPQPFERHLFRKRARAKQFRGDATP
jgi:hypothetical protein